VTKTVLESGLLKEQEEHYVLTAALPPLAFPATVHDALLARLDRLAAVKALAQLGATLGREFSYTVLQAVAPWHEEALRRALQQITYHPQSGWFEDTPLQGGTEEGCPLKGVHEGTFLIEAGHPAWNYSRASGLTVVLRLGLLYGLGSGAPSQDVLCSPSTPERQSLFESHRQRRWLTCWG